MQARIIQVTAQTSGRGAYSGRDQWILLLAGLPLQAAFLFFPLTVECDATMYYRYGQYLLGQPGGVFTSHRPPGFPLYLILTGQYAFDSFIGPVLGHALMGLALPVLLYRILAPFHRRLAFWTAVVYLATTQPFLQAKMLIADQLFSFLLLTTVYLTTRALLSSRPLWIYAACLTGFAAWFTRMEGAVALVGLALVIAVVARQQRLVRHAVAAGLIVLAAVGAWSVTRSRILGDPRLVGSVSNTSGMQFLYRAAVFLPTQLLDWELALGLRAPDDQSGLGDFRMLDARDDRIAMGRLVVQPSNGPASTYLHDLIVRLATERPESYRALKGPLSQVTPYDPALKGLNTYDLVFGRFEGRPRALADNMFAEPNGYVMDYLMGALPQLIGLEATDAVFRDVALEGVRRHPLAAVVLLRDAVTFFGVDIRSALGQGAHKRPYASPLWNMAEQPHYAYSMFNAGGCAQTALTPRLWASYEWDARVSRAAPTELFFKGTNVVRNSLRLLCGLLALATWWVLPWSRHRLIFLTLAGVAFVMMAVISVSVGAGAHTKYEHSIQPLMLIVTCGSIVALLDRRRDRRVPLQGRYV